MTYGRRFISLSIGFMVLSDVASGAGGTFMPLGELAGGNDFSRANAISPDGLTVVGQSSSGVDGESTEAFVWTLATGIVPLGDLDEGRFESIANGVAQSGAIVGRGHTGVNLAVVWPNGVAPPFELPELPGGGIGGATAEAITPDGVFIVGSDAAASGREGFLYGAAGIAGLGDLAGGTFRSDGHDLSDDGTIVVGSSISGNGTEAFRWTAAGGMVGLGDLPDGTFLSIANAISGDGTVIVGQGRGETGETAFRWTAGLGLVALHTPEANETSRALGTNADGSVIVGRRVTPRNEWQAFVWTAIDGLRPIADVLTEAGVDLTGWSLRQANAVSADGRTIVGYGTNPSGWTEAWMAVIPSHCPADIDGDGTVAFGDLLELLSTWGPCADPTDCPADLTGDGTVAFDDLLAMLSSWGACP